MEDQADLAAQRLEREIANILAIEAHATFVGIVEARDEAGERRFARTRRPDDGDALPGLYVQVYVGKDGHPLAVLERNPIEENIARQSRRRLGAR